MAFCFAFPAFLLPMAKKSDICTKWSLPFARTGLGCVFFCTNLRNFTGFVVDLSSSSDSLLTEDALFYEVRYLLFYKIQPLIKHNNPTTRMTTLNNRHSFKFEGGDDLTTMGASWFISYLYYITIDSEHRNWEKPKTKDRRISVFIRSQCYSTSKGLPMHRHYVEQVCSMSPLMLSKNKIGISGEKVLEMAGKLRSRLSLHQ